MQVEPTARDSETWAYMPAFGERRMTAGLPISMIPVQKYKEASERIRQVFAEDDPAKAHSLAAALDLQYSSSVRPSGPNARSWSSISTPSRSGSSLPSGTAPSPSTESQQSAKAEG